MSLSIANRHDPGSDAPAEPEPAARHRDRKARLYALDLLRFGAAALVLSYHLLRTGQDPSNPVLHAVHKIPDYGWMGVQLFFMISGFVICMSSWGRSLADFFISRTVRLLPAYVFAVLLTAGLLFAFRRPGSDGPPFPMVVGNLTMIQKLLGVELLDFSYWTLMVELMFYLCFAVLVAFGLTYKRVLAFCLLYTTVSLIAQAGGEGFLVVLTQPEYTSYFVVGVVLYLMYRFGPNLLLWGILAASGLLCVVSLSRHVGGHAGAGERVNLTVAFAILCGYFLVMVAVALGWLNWIRLPALALVGALTYPLYLLHQTNGSLVVGLLHDDMPRWLLLTGLVAALLVASLAIHLLIERPVGRAMRRGLRSSFGQIRAAAHDDATKRHG